MSVSVLLPTMELILQPPKSVSEGEQFWFPVQSRNRFLAEGVVRPRYSYHLQRFETPFYRPDLSPRNWGPGKVNDFFNCSHPGLAEDRSVIEPKFLALCGICFSLFVEVLQIANRLTCFSKPNQPVRDLASPPRGLFVQPFAASWLSTALLILSAQIVSPASTFSHESLPNALVFPHRRQRSDLPCSWGSSVPGNG